MVIVILAFIAGFTMFFSVHSRTNIDKYLDLGAKYLEEQKYDEAISAYTEAIKIDDMCAEAYIGLADAYLGKNDYDNALRVLQEGYEKTQSDIILKRINDLTAIGNSYEDNPVYSIEKSFPLTQEGANFILLAKKSDGLTLNGKSYNIKDFCRMDNDGVIEVLECEHKYNADIDFDYYDVPEKYSSIWFYYDDGGYTIDVYDQGKNEIIYNYTRLNSNINANMSEYGYGLESSLLTYNGIADVPEYLNGKELLQYLNQHNLSDLNSLSNFLCGESIDEKKCLCVNLEQMICYYDYQTYGGSFIRIDGDVEGVGDIEINEWDDGRLAFAFLESNALSQYNAPFLTQ